MEQPKTDVVATPKPKVKKPSAKKEKEPPTFKIEHGHFVVTFK
jgi:hypothetical protein